MSQYDNFVQICYIFTTALPFFCSKFYTSISSNICIPLNGNLNSSYINVCTFQFINMHDILAGLAKCRGVGLAKIAKPGPGLKDFDKVRAVCQCAPNYQRTRHQHGTATKSTMGGSQSTNQTIKTYQHKQEPPIPGQNPPNSSHRPLGSAS